MTHDQPVCLICGRTESEIPLVTWRYQGRELWTCPDCIPTFIHQRDEMLVRWQAPTELNRPPSNRGE